VSYDIEELVKQAKRDLTVEQIKKAILLNTYGGDPVKMVISDCTKLINQPGGEKDACRTVS